MGHKIDDLLADLIEPHPPATHFGKADAIDTFLKVIILLQQYFIGIENFGYFKLNQGCLYKFILILLAYDKLDLVLLFIDVYRLDFISLSIFILKII